MNTRPKVSVIIPVLNEESSIGKVIESIPKGLCFEIICVDNGSSDSTADIARSKGARVVEESVKGYGSACWTGVCNLSDPDIVVFLDGDLSDYPEEMPGLIQPIVEDAADLVIGSRMNGCREPGALPPHSLFGNWLASRLLNLFFGNRCTDLGPFRAIKYDRLIALDMKDRRFGWTMEMQAKAVARGYKVVEIPVSYRKRIGRSKITGNLKNSFKAGYMIIAMCFTVAWNEKYRGKLWGFR